MWICRFSEFAVVAMSSIVRLLVLAAGVHGSMGLAQPLASGLTGATPAQRNQTKLYSFHLRGQTGFEANLGQAPPRVRFFLRMRQAVLLITGEGATLALASEGGAGHSVIRMKLPGISPRVRVEGVEELVTKTNYFSGADPAGWVTGVPQYASVRYRGVYPGVDLVFRQSEEGIEYDWVVAPGGDFRRIRMIFEGVDGLDVNSDGALVARSNGMVLRSGRPIGFQGTDPTRERVGVQYRIERKKREARFSLLAYDPAKTLVIDPVLTYSAVFGGSGFESLMNGLELDVGRGIAIDSSGNAYIVGTAYSQDFSALNSTIAQGGGGGGRFYCEIEPGRLRADLLDLSRW